MIPGVVLRRMEELNETDAPLGQPAPQEALAAELFGRLFVGSVKFVSGGAFAREVEGFRRFPLHPESQFKRGNPRLQFAVIETVAFVEGVELGKRIQLGALAFEVGG